MPKFYCFNCGFGTDYTLKKPKVCLKCNQSFVSVAAKPNITIPNKSEPVIEVVNKPYQPKFVRSQFDPKVNIVNHNLIIDEDDDITVPDDLPTIDKSSFAAVDANRNCSSLTYSQLLKEAKQEKTKVIKTNSVKRKTKKS